MKLLPDTIKPLERKEIIHTDWYKSKPDLIAKVERVLFFDPTEVYKRVEHLIDPYKRHVGISMEEMFPKIDGKCACGCEEKPPSGEDWQRKWATDSCQSFTGDVLSIINNYFGKPAKYVTLYYGKICSSENCEETYYLELDHIIGVKQGGGGCWLSNYRWLCKSCHNNKTNKDFKWKEYKPTNQISMTL